MQVWLRAFMSSIALFMCAFTLSAQCKLVLDEVDVFDSTRTVAAKPVNVGFLVPSNFETGSGPKMIEEAKLMFSYSENDSIRSFFLTVAVPEREYLRIDDDLNVLILLEDEQVIALMNISDQGVFDPQTNMRLYQHVCVVPMDLFFVLTHFKLLKIRIQYRTAKRTIELSARQQEAFRSSVRCVGEAVGMLRVKP